MCINVSNVTREVPTARRQHVLCNSSFKLNIGDLVDIINTTNGETVRQGIKIISLEHIDNANKIIINNEITVYYPSLKGLWLGNNIVIKPSRVGINATAIPAGATTGVSYAIKDYTTEYV